MQWFLVCGSARNARLLQSNGHPSRTEGYRQTKLCSNQFQDDTVCILKPRHPRAAADRKSGRWCRIRAGDVRRGPQIVRGARKFAPSDADGAVADGADT